MPHFFGRARVAGARGAREFEYSRGVCTDEVILLRTPFAPIDYTKPLDAHGQPALAALPQTPCVLRRPTLSHG